MSRYIPVAARRRALEIYRNRRRGGGRPWEPEPTPMAPLEAMLSTRQFFAGHLAVWVAKGEIRKDLLDGYRAADLYLRRLQERPRLLARG